ncbi:MAG: RiPP maturation radical SAM C-methyltransferase [Polyangia bacterium]
MKIALVAMPWNWLDSPSPALGVLSAFVRQQRPQHTVTCLHAFPALATAIGMDLYGAITSHPYFGDLAYAACLYPDSQPRLREHFLGLVPKLFCGAPPCSPGELFETLIEALNTHLEAVTQDLLGYDVVGFTTTCSQLFASVAASKLLKHRAPSIRVVLGGSTVSLKGALIEYAYPHIDHVVRGEGEWPFVALLDRLSSSAPSALPPSSDDPAPSGGTYPLLVEELDSLPTPDYADYPSRAEELNSLEWIIPIEGCRGCWWNRVARTGNPLDSCRFCSDGHAPYRSKSVARIVEEMESLADRYDNVHFVFSDQTFPHNRTIELAEALRQSKRRFSFHLQFRASIHPYEIMRLWSVGCRNLQVGVEGLSTAYLRRIGKGTTTIQNLQAMKTCFELGAMSGANLLLGFPGSTQDEVRQTVHAISKYAIAYEPLRLSRFYLDGDNSVYSAPSFFPVSNIRNADAYGLVIPQDVLNKVRLPHSDFDPTGTVADWSEVEAAVERWRGLHQDLCHRAKSGSDRAFYPFYQQAPLYYEDWKTSLAIYDRRRDCRHFELDGRSRAIYLYCAEIRSSKEVVRRFGQELGPQGVQEILEQLFEADLLFLEGGKCLSLAVAATTDLAVERIEAAWEQRQADGG